MIVVVMVIWVEMEKLGAVEVVKMELNEVGDGSGDCGGGCDGCEGDVLWFLWRKEVEMEFSLGNERGGEEIRGDGGGSGVIGQRRELSEVGGGAGKGQGKRERRVLKE